MAASRRTAPLLKDVETDPAKLLYGDDGLAEVIVDSSAIVAVLKQEPEAASFAALMTDDPRVRFPPPTTLKPAVVIDRAGPVASRGLDQFIDDAQISIEPVSARQAEVARQAYRDFGKGSGHPAGLRSRRLLRVYALAVESGEPLLYKGDDLHTGIAAAWDSQA